MTSVANVRVCTGGKAFLLWPVWRGALKNLAPRWTYIGGIERGEHNLSLLNIVKVARALKITPSELLASIR